MVFLPYVLLLVVVVEVFRQRLSLSPPDRGLLRTAEIFGRHKAVLATNAIRRPLPGQQVGRMFEHVHRKVRMSTGARWIVGRRGVFVDAVLAPRPQPGGLRRRDMRNPFGVLERSGSCQPPVVSDHGRIEPKQGLVRRGRRGGRPLGYDRISPKKGIEPAGDHGLSAVKGGGRSGRCRGGESLPGRPPPLQLLQGRPLQRGKHPVA